MVKLLVGFKKNILPKIVLFKIEFDRECYF